MAVHNLTVFQIQTKPNQTKLTKFPITYFAYTIVYGLPFGLRSLLQFANQFVKINLVFVFVFGFGFVFAHVSRISQPKCYRLQLLCIS